MTVRKFEGKRAAALSLETIAVAAIILVVLIIVIAVFKGGIDKVLPTIGKVNECEKGKGGKCFDPNDPSPAAFKCTAGTQIWGLGCEKNAKDVYCCVPSK